MFVGTVESGTSTLAKGGPKFDRDFQFDFLGTIWPSVELIVSWMWVRLGTKRYIKSQYRSHGNIIAAVASILPLALFYWWAHDKNDRYTFLVLMLERPLALDKWVLLMMGIPLLGHWTARLLWLKTDRQWRFWRRDNL
jgi:hypothetical protein